MNYDISNWLNESNQFHYFLRNRFIDIQSGKLLYFHSRLAGYSAALTVVNSIPGAVSVPGAFLYYGKISGKNLAFRYK